jgi:hypothetical protein
LHFVEKTRKPFHQDNKIHSVSVPRRHYTALNKIYLLLLENFWTITISRAGKMNFLSGQDEFLIGQDDFFQTGNQPISERHLSQPYNN